MDYGLNPFRHKLAKIERRIFDAYHYDERRRDGNLFIQTIKDNRFRITRLNLHKCYVENTIKITNPTAVDPFA